MANEMPTGAKAVAAVAFAVVGWLIANAYVPNMPEAQTVGFFRELTAVVGIFIGWRVMGPSVGKGYYSAIGSGLKTVIMLIFMSLLLFGIYEMLQQSVKMVYDGPMDAIIDVFGRMIERAPPLIAPNVLAFIVIGGAIGGIMAENASRRWR